MACTDHFIETLLLYLAVYRLLFVSNLLIRIYFRVLNCIKLYWQGPFLQNCTCILKTVTQYHLRNHYLIPWLTRFCGLINTLKTDSIDSTVSFFMIFNDFTILMALVNWKIIYNFNRVISRARIFRLIPFLPFFTFFKLSVCLGTFFGLEPF